MARIFPIIETKRINRSNLLLDVTIRDFSGGWNVVDNDLNLTTKFSKVLRNMQRGIDGSISIRYGTELFADCTDYFTKIINIVYYNGRLVVVGSNGKIVTVDASGKVAEVWTDEWAGNLNGNPTGWSETVFVSFAIFNGDLIIVNGINKPLIMKSTFMVEYLKDLFDKTNVNTPICKYVKAFDRYLLMAGDPLNPDRLYISNTDTSGTWLNDSAPNNAVNIDLGSRVPFGDHSIKGLGRFRDKIIIAFGQVLLPGTLGIFDANGNHTPTFDDVIEANGSISHRAIQNIGEDLLLADPSGVPSVRRALFTGTLKPERLSQLVDPAIQLSIGKLKTIGALEDRTFSVYNKKIGMYMLFVPNNDDEASTIETRCFAYESNRQLKIEAWSDYRDWKFTCGCRTALDHVFFGNADGLIFRLGDEDHVTKRADYVGDQETWDDDTTFGDQTGFNPVADFSDSGIPIRFAWELPWVDNGKRFNTKGSRYIGLDVSGELVHFTLKMFVDNIYEDMNDLGEKWLEDDQSFDDLTGFEREEPLLAPRLETEFVGGHSSGYGNVGYGSQGFGSGRPAQDELLYAWTASYKINKMRIEGETLKNLNIISLTHVYTLGSIRR